MQEIIGFTIKTLGELLIAFTVFRVHQRVLHEHKIDAKVFKEMKIEQKIAIVGALMIIGGFLLHVTV